MRLGFAWAMGLMFAAGTAFADPVEVRAAGTVENGVDTWAVADLVFAGGATASVRTGGTGRAPSTSWPC